MASSSTPSSSITTLPKKHEVFLSFRGEDTRHGFTSHLYDALCRKQIETFIDDDKLERGDEISPALLGAIRGSKIAVVIFSEDYASSKWCLRELAEIIECKKMNKLIVMPVFYNVDPSDVRKQTGSFERSFANYEEIGRAGIFSWFSCRFRKRKEKELQEEAQKWREALTEASNLSGWDSSVIRTESKLVGDIVEGVWRKLMNEYISASSHFEGLIGIHKRIEHVMSLLCLEIEDVRIIGIWGMGGIGKTTIARAVFDFISNKFGGACFIEKVGKRLLENDGTNRLQREVLSEVLHEKNLKLGTPTICPFIMQMFNKKKVFIVLDDVNNFLQSETLVERLRRCGLGSRIIITSRDKQVLCNFKVDDHEIYEEKGLNDDEALELFRQYANPTEDCMTLSKKIVNYAKGNPLALKVLGSSLKGKSKQVWESALNNLQGIVYPEVFDVLKNSYDGLNEEEQSLFLDIACFKDLYNTYDGMLKILDKYSLSVLIAKSLVTIDEEEVEMHDLLQEMGREIVRRESPKIPSKRSRLWEQDDVIKILQNNTGTDAVEVISLDMDGLEDEGIDLSPQVFDNMHNLRFLLFYWSELVNVKVYLSKGLNFLPNKLMILYWRDYPLRALPSNFNPKQLVKLDLSFSNIEQFWEETKGTPEFPKLKWLILIYCAQLTRIPNLSDFPVLEEVDLSDCYSLVDFTSSVQQHNNLRNLNLSHCISVTKFPLISGTAIETLNLQGTAIEEVPSSIQSLTNLSELDLSECTRLKHISTSICKLKSLKRLRVSGSAIGQLPSSITRLENLEELDCSRCSGLTRLPLLSGLHSLQKLCSENCSLMEIPEDIGCLSSLKELKLCGNMFESLPKSIKQLSKLEFLSLSHCKMLRSLPEFPESLRCLEATDCDQLCLPDASEFLRPINFIFTNSFNLKAVNNVFEESLRIMQRKEKGFGKSSNASSIFLLGNKIPEWFSYRSPESSVNIQVLRNDLVNRKFMGIAVCAVLGFEEYRRSELYWLDDYCAFCIYHDHIRITDRSAKKIRLFSKFMDSEHMFLGYCSFSSFYSSFQNPKKLPISDSDYLDISTKFTFSHNSRTKLKCCAVHPIYAEEPSEIIGATIQEIGETSGRSDRSDDNDEEPEPLPKGFNQDH